MPRSYTAKVLEPYDLPLLYRLASTTRSSTRDLASKHRNLQKPSYGYAISPPRSGVAGVEKMHKAVQSLSAGTGAVEKRAVQGYGKRALTTSLDRRNGTLKPDQMNFQHVLWRENQSPSPGKRWKRVGRGWTGVWGSEDMDLQIKGKGGEVLNESSAEDAKVALNKALSRAANKALMGGQRREGTIFGRAKVLGSEDGL